ncbi:MAG: EF-P 5-aminopentanol modification-associated protein YfmF [Bacilli bacterium]
MNYEKYSYGAYNLHIINTNKFKTIKVTVNFRTKSLENEITIRNILKMILLNSCKDYPKEKDLIIESENLYDLKVSSLSSRVGNYSILSFNLEFLNEKYTEKNMNEYSLDFFMNLLFKPNVQDNKFDQTSFNVVTNVLRKSINSIKDNKTKYSIIKVLEVMNHNMPYSFNPFGKIEELDSITPESLYEYYKKVLTNDLVDILVVGEVDSERIREYFTNNFKVNTYKKVKNDILLPNILPRKKVKKIIEKDNVNQSKLAIGLRISNMTDYERKYVLRVYNEILGGGGNSMLFNTIREKHSLAYYINSFSQFYDNIAIIYAGVNSSKINMAIKLIKDTLNKMGKGIFSDEDLNNAIQTIISAIEVSEDSNTGIINNYYAQSLVNADNLDIKIKKYSNITKEDVVNIAKKIKMDTIYILEGDINEND